MNTANQDPFPSDAEILRQSRVGLSCARAAGVACGLFLFVWTPLNVSRWGGQAPDLLLHVETLYFPLMGVFLCLPWRRLQPSRWWRPLWVVLTLLCVGLAFLMVADLMFLYMLAAEAGARPPPPAFQGAMLFLCLLQPPVLYFDKRPELLH